MDFRENLATGKAFASHSPVRFFAISAWRSCASTAQAQLLSRRDLSYSIAKDNRGDGDREVHCKRLSPFAAVVVDRAGETIVALRGDNASPHTHGERAPQGLHCTLQLPHLNHSVAKRRWLTATPWSASK